MTDGIIQQAFKKIYDMPLSEFPISYNRVEHLEQELIEKIQTKQFRLSYKFPNKVVKLKDLIGDNKK